MVPTSIGGIAVLLLIVIPGLHYELLRERHRAGRDDSTFVEISRVLLSGFLLSSTAFFILGLMRFIGPDAVIDTRRLLEDKNYSSSHLILIAWSGFWFLTLTLTAGALMAARWPSDTGFRSATESAWVYTFARTPLDAAEKQGLAFPYIRTEITLKSGDKYGGLIANYSKNIDMADRELVLEGPLTIIRKSGGQTESVDNPRWHRLILPASEISSILVLYEAKPSGDSSSPQTSQHTGSLVRHPARLAYHRIKAIFKSVHKRRSYSQLLTQLLLVELGVLLICGLLTHLS
jgi:hypothetical protein